MDSKTIVYSCPVCADWQLDISTTLMPDLLDCVNDVLGHHWYHCHPENGWDLHLVDAL